MRTILEKLFRPSDKYLALALIRVYVAFHLLKKLAFIWPYIGVLYGGHSFVQWSEKLFGTIPSASLQAHIKVIVLVYACALLAVLFGIGKRCSIFLAFIINAFLQAINGYILNGGDNLIKFVLLYLCFVDSFRYLSIRPVFNKFLNEKISNLWTRLGAISISTHLALIYFISGMSKVNASVWYHGTALYYILQLERFSGSRLNQILIEYPEVLTLMTFASMFWELAFPFIVWIRKIRPYFLLFGIVMHLGIYVLMMIHDFEILFIALYISYFSDQEIMTAWRMFIDLMKRKTGWVLPKLFNDQNSQPVG